MEHSRGCYMDQVVYGRIEDLLVSDVNGETVMISIAQGKYFSIDRMGSYIWNLIQKPVKVSKVLKQLQEEFDGDLQTIEEDFFRYLDSLKQKKMICIEDAD